MPSKKQIQPGEKVPLKLTATERKLVLEDLMCLDSDFEAIVRDTPARKPVMMTLDELDDFAGYIAAESNHCDDKKKQKKLDAVFTKTQDLLDKYTDEEPQRIVKFKDASEAKIVSEDAAHIAKWAAAAITAAEQLRIKTKPLEHFFLEPGMPELLLLVPSLSKSIKNKMAKEKPVTVAEATTAVIAMAADLLEEKTPKPVPILYVAKHVMDLVQEGILQLAKPKLRQPLGKTKSKSKTKADTTKLFQFKISLLDSEPVIWRRIQVRNCTLDKLHEHIQTAMGWTNSHLHQFDIRGERYGDPDLLDDGFDDLQCVDSVETMVSDVVPKSGERFVFKYEYDFGDGWAHEVLFEGHPPIEKGTKYPVCLEGERACPPEDVGGVGGYQEFLRILADRGHEDHDQMVRWSGGSFVPDDFDSKRATRNMKKGLPD